MEIKNAKFAVFYDDSRFINNDGARKLIYFNNEQDAITNYNFFPDTKDNNHRCLITTVETIIENGIKKYEFIPISKYPPREVTI